MSDFSMSDEKNKRKLRWLLFFSSDTISANTLRTLTKNSWSNLRQKEGHLTMHFLEKI